MKRIGLFFLEGLNFLIYLLLIGTLFNINISYFKEYRIEASNLESAIEQIWPSAEIVKQWDLNGNKLYVFQTDSDYRYIFFPKALLHDRYALNNQSILYTYFPFDKTETITARLRHFKGTYYVEISVQELTITKVDKSKNLTGLPLAVQIIGSIIIISFYTLGFVRRWKHHMKNSE